MDLPMITTVKFQEEVVESKTPVLMVFGAPWCGYCRRLMPALMQLLPELEGKVIVGGINIDDEPGLAERFAVETVPSLIVVNQGKSSEALINPPSKAAIKQWLQEQGVI